MLSFCGRNGPGKWHAIVAIAILLGTAVAAPAAEPIELRGYGKVSADLTPAKAVFQCENVEKADILLDKLQADLFWDKALAVTSTEATIKSAPVTVYTVPGYGSALIARTGNRVLVLGGSDEKQVLALAEKEPLLGNKDITSKAAKTHPIYLDYFDNKAYSTYASSFIKTRDSEGRRFMRLLGAGTHYQGPRFSFEYPAPGVMAWPQCDAEIQEAEHQHDLVVLSLSGGGCVPHWVRSEYPNNMMLPTATTVLGDWGGSFEAGLNAESWMAPLADRLHGGLGFEVALLERYGTSPALGAWFINDGSPGGEYTLGHGRAMRAWDASPTGVAGFQRWLRDECHWSLADLGKRWYGDPKRFTAWNEVALPDWNEFFGALSPNCYRPTSGWRWKNEKTFADGPLSADAAGWVPIALPPSQQIAFVSRTGVNYYDVPLDAGAWLAKQEAGSDAWLVFSEISSNKNTRVWLNGQPLKLPDDNASHVGSFAVRITGLLHPGANDLQVALECDNPWNDCFGELAGPVFLTAHEPKRFPHLGSQANARYADLADWQAWAITDYHRQAIKLARKLDPNRPLMLMAGVDELYDYSTRLCADFNMGQENTGREAYYAPWFASGGLAAGYYGTAEESGLAKGTDLDRSFGWSMFDADSGHTLYPAVEAYESREKADGWFTKHRRQINLFGKYLREQPGVALLYSGQSRRFSPVGYSDIGLDALPESHYDNVYVTEMGLKNGLADPYPVLFDIGNQFMDADVVAAINKYVTQGGSFVAISNTGLHTGIEPDSYPLAKVSGFKPATGHGGKLHFESQLPCFKGWEKREFEGQGIALVPSSPSDQSLIPLARWADGSVAIGYRKVGRGQIITLGCSLWKNAKDLSGQWKTKPELQDGFFQRLLADCGVNRNANASTPDIWARKMVTKNGLQNWLLAYNAMNKDGQADLWMAVDGKPDQVIDLDTNESVPFVFESQGISVKDVQFHPHGVRIFAVRRATLASGLPLWWYEKTRYWKRTAAEVEAANMTLPAADLAQDESVIPISQWHFRTDPDGSLVKQRSWTSLSFDAAAWDTKGVGPWNLFDAKLKDYSGIGLYRSTFAVPPSWNGRRILLNLYNFDDPIVYDAGDFFLNGTLVTSYKAHSWSQTYNYDVTKLIQPGENIIALKVTGGPKNSGLGGNVWIEAPVPLSQPRDLAGTWQAVKGDWLTHTDTVVPGPKIKAKYLTRQLHVPAEWAGKDIFVEWSSREQWVGSVVINGHPINYNGFGHPYGLIARVNVSPLIKPGDDNVIEVWPYHTMTNLWGGQDAEESDMQLDTIRIGCQSGN